MKNNKIIKGLYTGFSIIGLLTVLSVAFLVITNASGLDVMLRVIGLVKAESLYQPHGSTMIEGATAGIVESLNDPYSRYLNRAQYQELSLQLNAEFGGIGVPVIEIDTGKLGVLAPFKGTPAARAGLKQGDIIISINGESAVHMSQDDAVNLMRGDPGTQLLLSVFRPSDSKEYNFKIVREMINIPSVESQVLPQASSLGYIKLNQFHARSTQEIADSVNSLNSKNIKGLILDLRNNGGGDFNAAIAIADIFLDEKEVVSVKDAKGRETIHKAEAGSYKVPMVVLVNGNSASASEILAGALQDNDRAILVGETTYGKGLVQTIFPLRNGKGGALKLTTQKYFTPKGTDINKIGINPDYNVKNPEQGGKDLQLQRAIELLESKQ